MIESLLWIILLELTAAILVGGYVLREIQTALAVIVLHDCAEHDDTVKTAPPVLTPEVLDADPVPPADDDKDTIGTFTGTAWN